MINKTFISINKLAEKISDQNLSLSKKLDDCILYIDKTETDIDQRKKTVKNAQK